MRWLMIVLLMSLFIVCFKAQNSLQYSIDDEFDSFMNGLFEVAEDGTRFSEVLPCKNSFYNQTININNLIRLVKQPLDFNKIVAIVDSLAPISDSFGIILTHCLPCFKQIDTYIDEIRSIINTDYNSLISFVIDSLKKNYLQLAKEAVEIYDLRNNYSYDRNKLNFFNVAGKITGFLYNKLKFKRNNKFLNFK